MAEKKNRTGQTVVFGLLGLLILSLGGFGIGNFGGSVRTIGSVGETEIPVNDYAVALQGQLRNVQARTGQAISLSTPQGQGLAEAVRRQLIAEAALDGETARLGLSVGDAAVQAEVLRTAAFQGLDGSFDRAAYAEVLRRSGMSEAAFENNIRAGAASSLTRAAVLGGVEAPQTLVDTLAAFVAERRDILWLRLDETALTEPLPAPTEAQLQTVYDGDPETYTEPERRQISYVSLTPEMMAGSITVEEDRLRAAYDDRSGEYNSPERRLVERLVYPDMAAAEAARAALDSGSNSFEALVQGRGLSLADVDLGDVTREDLGAAAEPVFALGGPGVAGPIETALGPALFRVNAILAAQNTPFEDVRADLNDELALERARREIAEQREAIDDLLAGGATLEEVAAETGMEFDTVELAADTSDGIAGYAGFRNAAETVAVGDFPEIIDLEDGGLAALRLDTLLAPALLPFEDVHDRLLVDWQRQETEGRLLQLAERIITARAAGDSFEAQGFAPEARTGLPRESFLEGAPEGLIGTIFTLADGAATAVAADGVVHVVALTAIKAEDPTAPETMALRQAITQTVAESLTQDLNDRFVSALEAEAGITLNQAAINAVHAQFP